MVKQATARNRTACRDGRADLRHSDGTTIAFADDTADVACSVHTVYVMPDPTRIFAEIARVLRPDGGFVLACRTSDTPAPAWMDPDIYCIPTAGHVTSMITTAGFYRVDHQTVDAAGYTLHLFAAHLGNVADAA